MTNRWSWLIGSETTEAEFAFLEMQGSFSTDTPATHEEEGDFRYADLVALIRSVAHIFLTQSFISFRSFEKSLHRFLGISCRSLTHPSNSLSS